LILFLVAALSLFIFWNFLKGARAERAMKRQEARVAAAG
jgi:hypothetical protein